MPFTRTGGQQISQKVMCADNNITVDRNQEESGLFSRILYKFPKFLFYLFAELVCQRFAGQFAGQFVNVEVETVISLSIAFILKRSSTHFVCPILIHQINLILCRATSLVPLQMQRFSVLRVIVKVDIQIAPEYDIFVSIFVFWYNYRLVLACQNYFPFSLFRSSFRHLSRLS